MRYAEDGGKLNGVEEIKSRAKKQKGRRGGV